MKPQGQSSTVTSETGTRAVGAEVNTLRRRLVGRRWFLKGVGAVGATLPAGALLATEAQAANELSTGDVAILKFLSALEIIETDLWQQYNELGGVQDAEVPGGSGSKPYTDQLNALDADMSQYIHDNTEDEISHFTFINAYLVSKGSKSVNLDKFRTLPSSQATGAQKQLKRLTNLMELSPDTSWFTRYRSRTGNPDLGDTFAQAIPDLKKGRFPAIPRTDNDLKPDIHIQAIAQTAAFHFGTIEQGGSSLYPSLAQRVTNVEVLRILLSIGPTETMHFQTWQDKAGNAKALKDPTNGLNFPDLNKSGSEDTQTNLIMPEPTAFLQRTFPAVSIIRPTETKGAAMGAVKALTADGLFRGQSKEFSDLLHDLAQAADAARRET
jgi:hypothetical protein